MIRSPGQNDPQPCGEPLLLEPERREREGLSCNSSDSRSLAAGPLSSLLTTKGGALEPRGIKPLTEDWADAPQTVVGLANSSRIQNGHSRDDTRDVSRRIRAAEIRLICRRNGALRDRQIAAPRGWRRSAEDAWLDDCQAFAQRIGARDADADAIVVVCERGGTPLYLSWIRGEERYARA